MDRSNSSYTNILPVMKFSSAQLCGTRRMDRSNSLLHEYHARGEIQFSAAVWHTQNRRLRATYGLRHGPALFSIYRCSCCI